MADRDHASTSCAAYREPVLKYRQPVCVKIPARFIKQEKGWCHGFKAGDGDHTSLRGVQIQRMSVGDVR